MNDDSILGNTLGQLGQTVKQTTKQVIKIPKDIVEGIPEQVSLKKEPSPQDNKAMQSSKSSDESTREVVKGLYAKSDNIQKKTSDEDNAVLKGQPEFKKMIAGKSPEEQKKLLQLHQQLHKQTYYDPTFNPPKRQEERPAEKLEKEEEQKKQMEALEFEEKKKKELSPSVKQGTHEKVPGISG